jgi:hypothetical protein
MTTERDRVICVSLTEAEWQAFVARCPQPVDWLRQQILSQLPTPDAQSAKAPMSRATHGTEPVSR